MGFIKCPAWRNNAYKLASDISSKANTKVLKKMYQKGNCDTCQNVTCKARNKIYKPNNFKS